jgi:hypothetical protein
MVRDTLNAHVMLFECPNCGRPIPLVRLDRASSYPNAETMTDATRVQCLSEDCQWSDKILVVSHKHRWTVGWPHLKRPTD